MLLYSLEQIATAHPGQMPVRENEIRQRCVCLLFLEQKLDCLLAIMSNGEFPENTFAVPESLLNEVQVRLIVFYNEQANRLGLLSVVGFQRRYRNPRPPLKF